MPSKMPTNCTPKSPNFCYAVQSAGSQFIPVDIYGSGGDTVGNKSEFLA
jgi:hypothetical protein